MVDRFGNYELLRRLAQGGMAEVCLARFSGVEGFQRQVVIKRMLPELATRKDYVDMFLDEARLASRFNHPNIVQVYELGEKAGSYFMAMEFVDGPHLGVLFAHSLRIKKALPIPLCAYVVARAAEGLHHAHELRDANNKPLSIVHRDVSPQNILVSRDGDVKVMDFGVAKAAANTTHTRTGVIKGKIGYMSPEQCLANPLDRRTDVFALGIVLYELVTRRRLFRDKSDLVVMQKITTEDVPAPSTVNPHVPKELDALILRALRRPLDERTPSALDLAEALDGWLSGQTEPATRGALTRWMRENANDLGPGIVSSDGAGQQPTPSWGPSGSQGSSPAVDGANPGTPPQGALARTVSKASGLRTGGSVVLGTLVPPEESGPPTLEDELPAMGGLVEPVAGPVDPDAPTRARLGLSADPYADLEGDDNNLPLPPSTQPPGAGRSKAPLYVGAAAAFLVLVGAAWALLPGTPTGARATATKAPATAAKAQPPKPCAGRTTARRILRRAAVPAPASAQLGSLRILTDPPHAEITVNKVARGTTQGGAMVVDGLAMDPPEASVMVQLDGYDVYRASVPLVAGETITLPVIHLRRSVTPRSGVGQFDVTSEPSNLRLSIDGRAMGRTPLMRLELKEGTHTLLLEAPPGYQSVKTSIKSVAGMKQSLPYVLEKKERDRDPPAGVAATPAAPRDEGPKTMRVMVDTQPYWSYAFFNGKNLGPTPVGAELPVGKVTLRFKRDGKDGCTMDAARTVDITAGNGKVKILLDAKDAKGECL